ncbi:hypothetical protein SAMN04487972_101106 [Paracoccus halophilus]|uniref:Tellurite resistance protein TerB n=1 Tax=Paracoccus halophilus TaxID=376733 RepID=A0A099F8B3_9RHOB|nr:hypothetical protein [Paracoccus halophilus]KGJ06448.1 hypothetical protein IT41_02065 [Paracoccus halophilus]SFA38249.1 hypothetical protein SAMN04487972_101106 [Paracoccus halophilus]
MPFIIALLGLVLAAGVWAWRIRMAAQVSRDLADMAGDVISAARRLGFRRRLNVHPVESIEEPALAIAGIGIAFLELSSLPTAEQQKQLGDSIARNCNESQTRADELMIVGRWLVSECKGPQTAIPRLTKRLYQLDKTAFQPLLSVLDDVGQAGGSLSPRQRDALDEVSRGMKLS